MRSQWLALQIFAIALQLAGAFLIGNWWIIIGVAFMLWGYGIMTMAKMEPKGRSVNKDWLGNKHIE